MAKLRIVSMNTLPTLPTFSHRRSITFTNMIPEIVSSSLVITTGATVMILEVPSLTG